jgi:hypothetical protein
VWETHGSVADASKTDISDDNGEVRVSVDLVQLCEVVLEEVRVHERYCGTITYSCRVVSRKVGKAAPCKQRES